jgi:hypothetical protein
MRMAQTPRSIDRSSERAGERAALKSGHPEKTTERAGEARGFKRCASGKQHPENSAQREPCNPRIVGNLPSNARERMGTRKVS